MNKQKGIMIGVVIVILLAGGYWWWQFREKSAGVGNIPPPKPSLEVVTDDTIFGWLARGSAECAVTTDKGEVKLMAKKEKLRIDGLAYNFSNNGKQNNSGQTIVDGDWMYMWSGSEGTKLNTKELQKTMTPEQKNQAQDYSWTDTVKSWEASGYQYNCAEKKLGDELFVPPSNVKFTDLTKTMSDAQKLGNKVNSDSMSTEEIEAELERMKTTPPPEN